MSNLGIILFGVVLILSGLFFRTLHESFGYSLIAFGVVLEIITVIKILWEKGKIK